MTGLGIASTTANQPFLAVRSATVRKKTLAGWLCFFKYVFIAYFQILLGAILSAGPVILRDRESRTVHALDLVRELLQRLRHNSLR